MKLRGEDCDIDIQSGFMRIGNACLGNAEDTIALGRKETKGSELIESQTGIKQRKKTVEVGKTGSDFAGMSLCIMLETVGFGKIFSCSPHGETESDFQKAQIVYQRFSVCARRNANTPRIPQSPYRGANHISAHLNPPIRRKRKIVYHSPAAFASRKQGEGMVNRRRRKMKMKYCN